MNPAEILDVLEDHGAVLRGHFRLSSGRHSDTFVQKFRIFEHPRLTQRFGEAVADSFAGEFDAVASPALGAVPLGFATALATGARFLIAERVDGAMAFRRGFTLSSRERVLVVEDVVTTGGSAIEVLDAVARSGATPVGLGALIDRSEKGRPLSFGVPFKALLRMEFSSWDEAGCPSCAGGVPVTDPGSRRSS